MINVLADRDVYEYLFWVEPFLLISSVKPFHTASQGITPLVIDKKGRIIIQSYHVQVYSIV